MGFEKSVYRHRGITILRKRDPGIARLTPGKVALVLAGGAIAGSAFKVGGLRALDETFAFRRLPSGTTRSFNLTDCDVFVGLSSGSVLATTLSAGIGPDEVMRILRGTSTTYEQFSATEYMAPNWREVFERLGPFLGRQQELVTTWLSGATNPVTVSPYSLGQTLHKMLGSVPSLLPTGLFTTRRLAAYLRRNMDRVGVPDNFTGAYARFGKELYLSAVEINRGQRVIFGHDEPYRQVRISDAVAASCALPGWYRPVRIENPLYGQPGEPAYMDFVDGGLVRTANVRVAVGKGADLVICYNPFNRIRYDRLGRSLVDHGPWALASQIFRLLLGARLDLAKELLYFDDTVDADVIFVEPAEDDFAFFAMNPLDYWSQERAASHGYQSIRASIQANHARLAEVLATHGIELRPPDTGTSPVADFGRLTEPRDFGERDYRRRVD